jgi:hypothetical protein
VTFTAPSSGPSGTFSGKDTVTETTNANGIATAPSFTANDSAGSFELEVSATGMSPVFIQLTNKMA